MGYYAVDHCRGADSEDSPSHVSRAFTHADFAGQYTISENSNFHGAYDNRIRHKLHLQLDTENFTSWIRFTQRGERLEQERWQFNSGGWARARWPAKGAGYQ